MTDTDTLTQDDVELFTQEHRGEWTPTDPGDVAHIIDQKKFSLAEAYILGAVVQALCGYEWIPTKDPNKLPICEECKRVFAARGGGSISA